MRNSRQRRCSAAISQVRRHQGIEALRTKPEFGLSDFRRVLRAHNATLSLALDGTGFGQALPEL
jgi:hypothetical protein